jgi:hypothetical protein
MMGPTCRNPPSFPRHECAACRSDLAEPGENRGVLALRAASRARRRDGSFLTRESSRPKSTDGVPNRRIRQVRVPKPLLPMTSTPAFRPLPLAARRRVRRALHGAVHAVAMLAGLLSTGILPASILAASSEVESTFEEAPSAVYGQHHNEHAMSARRHTSWRYLKRGVALSTLPTLAGRLATSSASPALVSRLSLGLSIPMRC